MTLALKLPPELWLAIFDLIFGNYTRPYDLIGHLPFPDIIHHLREPWVIPPPIHPYLCNLRLVCHTFSDLLRYPYFLMKRPCPIIPTGTEAIYISSDIDALTSLRHILMDPLMCNRLTTLGMAKCEYVHQSAEKTAFHLLCDSATAFPVLRSLTLGFYSSIPSNHTTETIQSFWGPLNEAFPGLICLILRGELLIRRTDDEVVTFEKLEILNVDYAILKTELRFPVLRHAAIGPLVSVDFFMGCRTLESLLIRRSYMLPYIEWDLVPQLRLLGVPHSQLGIPSRPFEPMLRLPPPNHPFQHLYIYEDTDRRQKYSHEDRVAILKQIAEEYPTIALFTFAFNGDKGRLESETFQQAQIA